MLPSVNGNFREADIISRVRPVLVSFDGVDPMTAESIEAYERALLEARQEGITIRAVMLCNPHNPLGRLALLQSTGLDS